MSFIIKFELPSPRVKRVCFHPSRPWVLCGLHNGVVQIIDYRTRAVVDHYHEHEGPVRGADFHQSQPLFVTGGDDYKIKVWNYKLRRCLFTLTGHLDYIRMTQFHPTQPWIVSASDDSTVCLWNWQQRSRMAVLTGHNHYVMSAMFHPTQDLVVSASLDLTIRVWDISGLRSRRSTHHAGGGGQGLSQDLFGSNDVVVRYILEGHEQGVNYATFHPTKPFIASAADDRTVRIWRMEEMRTFELEQLRGHNNNVSAVAYFKDLLVSNSEDRSIRVWDPSSRSMIQQYRRPGDRFWTIAVHPTQNVLAAGHDSGMCVFKLERERPAFDVVGRQVYWVKDRALRSYDLDRKAEVVVGNVRRYEAPPTQLSVSPADNVMAMSFDSSSPCYELCSLRDPTSSKTGAMECATFFGTGRFVCLDRTRQLVIRTAANEISKVLPPVADANRVFRGPQGMVLVRSEDKVYLFDLAQKVVIAEAAVAKVRYVQWDSNFNKVALMSRNTITFCTRRLKVMSAVTEANKIKTCVFDDSRGVAIYATSDHLKYCSLHSGDVGTIRTLAHPIYLVHAESDRLWYITRENKMVAESINNTELAFKLAVQQEKYREVLGFIQQASLQGQALVAHLQKTGHPDIALHFVSDPLIKFHLALQCGILDVAKEVATELNQPDCWRLLARAAISAGDIQLSQRANAITRNFAGLGTQCIVTGNIAALQTVAAKSGDESAQMHFATVTPPEDGSLDTRVRLLRNAKQLPLAYSLAVTHGAEALAAEILAEMPEADAARIAKQYGAALASRQPIVAPKPVEPCGDNWPMLPVTESIFIKLIKDPAAYEVTMQEAAGGDVGAGSGAAGGAWGDDDDEDLFGEGDKAAGGDGALDVFGERRKNNAGSGANNGGEGGAAAAAWGEDDDLDDELDQIDAVKASVKAAGGAKGGASAGFVVPNEGESIEKNWITRSNIPALHAAAGSFRTAFDLLQRQIGLVDAAPLETACMQLWASTHYALPSQSLLPSRLFTMTAKPPASEISLKSIPRLPRDATVAAAKERRAQGYREFTAGNFDAALQSFRWILQRIPLVVIDRPEESGELRDLLAVAREYTSALMCEMERQQVAGTNPARGIELAAYLSTFRLQHDHLILAAGQAMTTAFKGKCKKTAAALARRLLDYQPPQEKADRARKVCAAAEADNTDQLAINYDERNPSVLCMSSLTPMYRGKVEPLKCCYCQAPADPSNAGKKCAVCQLSRIGGDVSGLTSLRGTSR
jgi:coatomer protein complex subunit alpha (xenin)